MQLKVANGMEDINNKLHEDTMKISRLEMIVEEQLDNQRNPTNDSSSTFSKPNKMILELNKILKKLESNLEEDRNSRSSIESNLSKELKTLKDTEVQMLSTLKSIERSVDTWSWISKTSLIVPVLVVVGGFLYLRKFKK